MQFITILLNYFPGVAFSATLGPEFNPEEVVLSDNSVIVFDVILLNVGEFYNSSTGIFTAPWNGL